VYLKKLSDFTNEDLNILHKHLVQFLQKNGGYDNNTKNHIVNKTAKILKRKIRYLSDLFLPPTVINRTAYFNGILNNLKDSRISSGYNGIDYMAVIDSEMGKLYTFTPTYIDDSNITADVGFCLLSLVKVNNSFIIRNVVIENGSILAQSTSVLNKTIKKFSKLLSMEYTVFSQLSDKNYKKCIDIHKANIKHPVSFIEFSSSQKPFFSNPVYQWTTKPLTINFLCKACPDKYIKNYGKSPANSVLYILYLTCSKRDFNYININYLEFHDELFSTNETQGFYFPLQFAPSTNPLAYIFWSSIKSLNNSMVDLTWNQKSESWDFVNKSTQHHGDYGDSFKTVEQGVWNSFRNPVKYSDLVLPIKDISQQMYFPFVKRQNLGHTAVVKLNTFVKNIFIENRSDKWVIDLAAGKAQDLWRYRMSRAQNLVMAEIDKDAVDIIINKKYEIFNKQQTLLVLNTDLNLPFTINLQRFHQLMPVKKVQYITCMFALHYLTGTLANIKNITSLIGSLLESGGEFLYTAFDPNRVYELLKKHKGQWDVKEDGSRKYSIVQKYKDSDFKDDKNVGWPISLTLPMNPDVYYSESLINEKILDSEFKKHKITIKEEGNFLKYFDQFKSKFGHHAQNINTNDKIFAGLYKFRLYKKSK
jgi:hypothetical protein